jgi:CRP/FNR family cyclic AMP-dependent transcriptional regulator
MVSMTSGHPREPFWYAMTDPQRAALLRIGKQRLHQPEEVILREHDRSDFALVLLDGCVKVSAMARHGYLAILGLRDGGELLGELAGADGSHRSATLTALTEVTALHLPGAEFGRFLRDEPDAAAALRRTLAARLREADRYRAAAGAEPAQQRLAALLIHLGRRYGVAVNDGGLLIELPLSQEDLAGLALTSLRTLGRILEQWRNLDLVVTGRRRILILSPARLGRLASTSADR